jgi:hypothetical protein
MRSCKKGTDINSDDTTHRTIKTSLGLSNAHRNMGWSARNNILSPFDIKIKLVVDFPYH